MEKRKRLEELYGVNFQKNSENISLMNESLKVSMGESLKAIRSLSQFPKIDFPLPKFNISNIEINIPKIPEQLNFPIIPKSLIQELGRISSLSKNFSGNTVLTDFSRQYQSLTNSNLASAILVSSFKDKELDLLKQLKFELPEFPKINLPKQALSDLAKTLNQGRIWETFELLRNTYIGNLAISMREAIIDSSTNEEVIEKIEFLYEENVAALPQNQFLREFFLSQFFAIIFLIISMWYSQHLSQQSSVELRMLFGQVFERLEKIEKADLEEEVVEDSEVYYVVQRTVSVKNQPNFKSFTIDYLSSDTKVHLIKSKGKWIYVEYIDYLEVVPRYGWVSKKYLKRLEK